MKTLTCSTLLTVALFPFALVAKQLQLDAKVTANYTRYDVESQLNPESSASVFSLEPSLITGYRSKKLLSSLSVNHFNLRQSYNGLGPSQEQPDKSRSYTNYSFDNRLSVIDNYLTLTARAAQSQQSLLGINSFTSNIYSNPNELSKTRQHAFGFNFQRPRADYVNLKITGEYVKIKSDRQTDNPQSLDNTNKLVQATITSGKALKTVSWRLQASHQDTKGSRTSANDIVSETLDGAFYIGFWQDFSLALTGQHESNEFGTSENRQTAKLTYKSVGAGISWSPKAGRMITITYNKPSNSNSLLSPQLGGQQPDEKSYLAGEVEWQFSSRTGLNARVGKRFFGESKSLSLFHASRSVKTRINYSENLTSFSRLILSRQSLGTFVCPFGQALVIENCFQPDSPNYQLQPNEAFVNFNNFVPEISQEATLRKSLVATIGYDFRRLKLALNVGKTESEFLRTQRTQDANIISLSTSFVTGAKSNISWTNHYIKTKTTQNNTEETEVVTSALTLNYKFNQKLTGSLGAQYSDRDSSNNARDWKNRSVSATLNYQF